MSNTIDQNFKKICLLNFRNKKVNYFDGLNSVISEFAGFGYYFDKVSTVTYNDSNEIVRAIKDGRDNYCNLIIYCPKTMENTFRSFVSRLYATEFDNLGVLTASCDNVFIIFSDVENKLTVSAISEILNKKFGVKYNKAYVKMIGAPIEKVNSAVSKAKSICEDIYFNITENYGDCKIEIVYNSETTKSDFDRVMRSLISALDDFIYALEDITISQRLVYLLNLRRMKIGVAESFTGGGIGKRIVEVPGASKVYYEGLNTYSNESKAERLGVKDFTLNSYGAVSEETASEMAKGMLRSGKCNISIATTGIAGPTSDYSKKPVGLTYIAIGLNGGVTVYKYNLKGSREFITETAINFALFLAYKSLK